MKKVVYVLLILSFATAGFAFGLYLLRGSLIVFPGGFAEHLRFGVVGLTTLIGLVMGIFLAPWLVLGTVRLTVLVEQYLNKTPAQDLLTGSVGLIIGLIIANLLGSILAFLGWFGKILWPLVTIMLGYLGLSIGIKKREDIMGLFAGFHRFSKERLAKVENRPGSCKILDTSVIIDGRVADLGTSGFIEGVLLIPAFILDELRHIADSPDLLKRNRGRRGLDILNKMRKDKDAEVKVQIYDDNSGLEDVAEVDTKLVKLAQKLGAKIITNDFNLNKVAELHGVKVLNINELANAVKPVVLPGEEMVVQVVKDGKEMGQGVAYLDDGTMIVVESGRRFINQTIPVLVTSVLQTAAGRMIFARPRLDRKSDAHYDEVKVIG